jgi:hypothetical protein
MISGKGKHGETANVACLKLNSSRSLVISCQDLQWDVELEANQANKWLGKRKPSQPKKPGTAKREGEPFG